MVRNIVLILVSIGISVPAHVLADIPSAQRKAVTKMVTSLAPTLRDDERRAIIDAEFHQIDDMKREATEKRLSTLAVAVADSIIQVQISLRSERVEQARVELRDLARHLIAAAQVHAITGSDMVSHIAVELTAASSLVGVTSGAAMFMAGKGLDSMILEGSGKGLLIVGALSFLSMIRCMHGSAGYTFPFGSRCARWVDDGKRMTKFWELVASDLRDRGALGLAPLGSVEDLKALLARDLPAISFDNACRGALLSMSPSMNAQD